jgi:hypothetical protein
MTTAKATPMIIYGKEVVDLAFTIFLLNDSGSEIKSLNRKVHKNLQLVSPKGA